MIKAGGNILFFWPVLYGYCNKNKPGMLSFDAGLMPFQAMVIIYRG